jgi:hypothetical protein
VAGVATSTFLPSLLLEVSACGRHSAAVDGRRQPRVPAVRSHYVGERGLPEGRDPEWMGPARGESNPDPLLTMEPGPQRLSQVSASHLLRGVPLFPLTLVDSAVSVVWQPGCSLKGRTS